MKGIAICMLVSLVLASVPVFINAGHKKSPDITPPEVVAKAEETASEVITETVEEESEVTVDVTEDVTEATENVEFDSMEEEASDSMEQSSTIGSGEKIVDTDDSYGPLNNF